MFVHRIHGESSERALVLHSLDIPYELVVAEGGYAILVPESFLERAKYEIWQYESENRKTPSAAPRLEPVYQRSAWGVSIYVVVISLIAVFASEAAFNRDWLAAGRVDGTLIRQGEWWRTVTALTLHADLAHFVGNVVIGSIFGVMAGRLFGPGLAWLLILLTGAAGNMINTLLLAPDHRSIGASTAVFAALGLVAGFSWRARLFARDRWAWRIGPVVGGVALLAFTGTGSIEANTDTGAHLLGFVCGFLGGMLMVRAYRIVPAAATQIASSAAALTLIVLCWLLAHWA